MVTASTSTTGLSSAMGTGSTLPASIPAPLQAPPAASGGSMTRPAMSLPKPIQEAERSEALHRGLVKVESTNSMLSEEASSMSTMSGGSSGLRARGRGVSCLAAAGPDQGRWGMQSDTCVLGRSGRG